MGDSDNNDEDTSPSAEQGGKVVVTDLLGLGAAAKSPAGKEIGKAIGKLVSVVTDPTRSLLMGLAKTKVDTKRITEIAKAEAQARQVDVASDQLIERMKRRVITDEIRRQINIEIATTDAIDIVDSIDSKESPRPIEDDWMHKWTEGVQEASASQVRQFWSRVLAAQSLAAKGSVSRPSLSLLQNLDSNLADALADYIAFVLIYGSYPELGKIRPNALSPRHLAMLREIGFLQDTMPKIYNFTDFKLRLGKLGDLVTFHGTVSLTHRGHELCVAIFEEDDPFNHSLRGKLPSDSDQVAMLLTLVKQAIEEQRGKPAYLVLSDDNKEDVVEIAVEKGSNEATSQLSKLIEELKAFGTSPSDRLVALLSRLTEQHLIGAVRKIQNS